MNITDEHNKDIGGKYTKDNRPFALEYYDVYTSYDLAKKRKDSTKQVTAKRC